MLVSKSNIEALDHQFSTLFRGGLTKADADDGSFTTLQPVATRVVDYSWLGAMPKVRRWLGARHHKGLRSHRYSFEMLKWESTIAVAREDIEDDQIGQYSEIFSQFGEEVGRHSGELAWVALVNGDTGLATFNGDDLDFGPCYDGSNFFATDHGDSNQSNFVAGGDEPWILIDPNVFPRAIIKAIRLEPELVARTSVTDDNVFSHDEFQWGARLRHFVGFGLWQGAYMSRGPLDEGALSDARSTMRQLVSDDHDKLLQINPRLLIVGSANETAARKLLNSELGTGGETNVMRNAFDLQISPFLTHFA